MPEHTCQYFVRRDSEETMVQVQDTVCGRPATNLAVYRDTDGSRDWHWLCECHFLWEKASHEFEEFALDTVRCEYGVRCAEGDWRQCTRPAAAQNKVWRDGKEVLVAVCEEHGEEAHAITQKMDQSAKVLFTTFVPPRTFSGF
jgi:hypothetical protein